MADESTIRHSLFPRWIREQDDCPMCYKMGILESLEIRNPDDGQGERVTVHYLCKSHHKWAISYFGRAPENYKKFLKEKKERADA